MAGRPFAVEVRGARELRSALGRVDKAMRKELRQELLHEVAEPAASAVRRAIPVRTTALSRRPPPGHWSSQIKAGATQRIAYIRWGRASTPGAGPTEFGGYPEGRPYIAEGRYVYPTVKRFDAQIERAAEAAFTRVARLAGF